MKKYISAFALCVIMLLTGCSRSVAMDKIRGRWSCEIDGTAVTIEITDESFMQSAGGTTGEPLKFERNSDGIIVRNTDGKQLLEVHYSADDDQLYYTVQTAEGDVTYHFSRSDG